MSESEFPSFHHRPHSASIVCPTVRMVVVHAWSVEGWAYSEVLPVVAIRQTVVDHWRHPDPSSTYPPHGSTPAAAEELGWTYLGTDIDEATLIADGKFGICTVEEAYEADANADHRVVACPWPAAEDDDRLADVVAAVERQAKENEAEAQEEKDSNPDEPPRPRRPLFY